MLWVFCILFVHISGMHDDSGGKETLSALCQHCGIDLLNCKKVSLLSLSSDLISMIVVGFGKMLARATTELQIGHFVTSSVTALLCLCAAEDGKDHYVEESEATTCETRVDESFLVQKPVARAKLEARTDSLQVPR